MTEEELAQAAQRNPMGQLRPASYWGIYDLFRQLGRYLVPYNLIPDYAASMAELRETDELPGGVETEDDLEFTWDAKQWRKRPEQFIAYMPAEFKEWIEESAKVSPQHIDPRQRFWWQTQNGSWWADTLMIGLMQLCLREPEHGREILQGLHVTWKSETEDGPPQNEQERRELRLVRNWLEAKEQSERQEDYAKRVGYTARHIRRLTRKWEARSMF